MSNIKEILEDTKVIAIVGLSPKEHRASNGVAKYLLRKGYTIIPVNPVSKEVLGQKCYKSLSDIPKDIKVDLVDVFRRGEETPPVAEEAVKINAKYLWLQLGISSKESKKIAEDNNLGYVENKCIKVEHNMMF